MARKLKEQNKTRLVLTGPVTQPTEMAIEYMVMDGDLSEPAKRMIFDGTDFNATIGDLWNDSVNNAKKTERL